MIIREILGYDESRKILKVFRPVTKFAKAIGDQDVHHIRPYIEPMFHMLKTVLDECKEYYGGPRAGRVLLDMGRYLIEIVSLTTLSVEVSFSAK